MQLLILLTLLTQLPADIRTLSVSSCSDLQCFNGGACMHVQLNATNSLQLCKCQPGFTGRQCTQLTSACQPDPCGNNGYCNPDPSTDSYFCRCKPGFTGDHCQENVNECLAAQCLNGGLCVDGVNSYECECQWPYVGRYCHTRLSCRSHGVCQNGGRCETLADGSPSCQCPAGYSGEDCAVASDPCLAKPCENKGTCVTLGNDSEAFYCQCVKGFTGNKCHVTVETTTSAPVIVASTTPSNNNETPIKSSQNGSFVLVVNISPTEFATRKKEIISEFERQFGVLLLIKKDQQGKELLHAFQPTKTATSDWTKIYFIIIFACLQVETTTNGHSQFPTHQPNLCLQNKVNDLTNNDEILSAFQQNSNLLPNYVSNITYEAYNANKTDMKSPESSQLSTILVICLAISLLTGISLALGVLLRQQTHRKIIKAPVWFPPPANDQPHTKSFTYNPYESVKPPPTTRIHKALDDFSHLFNNKPKHIHQESPDSSSSNCELFKFNMPSPGSPECYPSPPESLPGDQQQAVNLKSGSYGLTPLMAFILGRSKMQHAQATQGTLPRPSVPDADVVETFVMSGADLDAQNQDGETALHLSVRCGLAGVVERLLRHNSSLSTPDNYGRNVLHTAVGSNQLTIARILLEHCANHLANSACLDDRYDLVDAKSSDNLGDTPLIVAARLNHNKMLSLLLEYSAAVNATDHEGRSALHWAAKVNNASGAALLIAAGANVNMQDHDEKTPLSSALQELNTRETAELLIKCDAFVAPEDEAKYRKMASIGEALGHHTTGHSNELVAKLKQENLSTAHELASRRQTVPVVRQKTNNKRKLEETLESPVPQVAKRAQQEVYTPLTPSPPVGYSYQHYGYSQYPQVFGVQQQQSQYGYYSEGYAAYF